MAKTITLPDDIERLADSRAAAAGYDNVAEYVWALILSGANEPISPHLEDHLLRALDTPARQMHASDWDEKRRALGDAKSEGMS